VAISFHLHSELDVLVNSVIVIKEFSQLAGSMRPDDVCVIYIAKPAEVFMGRCFQSHFFKVLNEIVCNVGLLVELAIEAEKGGSQDMAEKS
jgi:hypothetical protein